LAAEAEDSVSKMDKKSTTKDEVAPSKSKKHHNSKVKH
jgi:hypothetical protein